MQIFVLGMHRSGTSAITRIVNMMGASLGPAQLISGPAFDNPKGFWELRNVSALNDSLLQEIDCRWDDIAALSAQRFDRLWPEPLIGELEQALFQLDTDRPWVLKDPRLCLTLPVWRRYLEVPVCILAYRSPVEVAKSLAARNNLPLMHGIALWEKYTLHSLQASAGLPRTVLSYEQLLQRPMETVRELYGFLCEEKVGGLRLPSEREVTAFLDNTLQHHACAADASNGLLNTMQEHLAKGMQDGTALNWPKVPELSACATEVLELVRSNRVKDEDAAASLQRLQANLFDVRAEFDRRINAAAEEAAAKDEQNNRLSTALVAAKDREQQLNQKLAQVDRLHSDLEHLQTEIIRTREDLDVIQTELAQAQHLAQERNEQVALLSSDLALLSQWLGSIDELFTATLKSWRWRLGHSIVSIAERLLLRQRVMLAVDHIRNLLDHYRHWSAQPRTLDRGPATALPILAKQPVKSPSSEARAPAPRYDATYDLVCLANIDWDARYQRPQQLAAQFARHGHRVFYVVASRVLPPDDAQGFRARSVAENIFEVELMGPAVPDRYGTVLDAPTLDLFMTSLARLRNHYDIVDAVCDVHLAFWTPLAWRMRETWGWPVLYDCMDEWEDFPGIGTPLLEAERELIKSSDLVTVTAALLQDKLSGTNRHCTLVRNGVDFDFFRSCYRPSTILGDLSHPIIGFYGALAEWVDLGLIAAVARSRPDWQFVLIGDVFVTDLEGLDKLPNVQLLGRRPYEDMPRYLYHFDACLIPFRLNQVTHAVDPVKFYEYVSNGTPVVAVPLKELAIYEDYLYFATTPDDFVEQLEAALAENDTDRRQSRIALAQSNDWAERYQTMSAAIQNACRRVSIIVVTYKNVELTQLCLESLLRNTTHPNYEIIVVDNDSRDGTSNYLRYLSERYDRVKIILNNENRGFAAANNQGLVLASGDDLVLLNNDTVTPRGWLAPLLRHLRDPSIGLVGPVTNFVGNEAKIEVPYQRLEDMQSFARNHMRTHSGQIFDIKILAMFCVAMRRELYEQVGPLDETFGIGMFEDDDYSNRIRALGYRIVCAEDAFVHHFGQAAFKKLIESGEYQRIWDANQAYYEKKWGKWQAHIHRES